MPLDNVNGCRAHKVAQYHLTAPFWPKSRLLGGIVRQFAREASQILHHSSSAASLVIQGLLKMPLDNVNGCRGLTRSPSITRRQ